ncbi:MAG: hypothetical protein WCO06_01135 [Candidatus Roizmanbacteria bacterium]
MKPYIVFFIGIMLLCLQLTIFAPLTRAQEVKQDIRMEIRETESDSDPRLSVRLCSLGTCPTGLQKILGDKCVSDFKTFKSDPWENHIWIEDPEVTSQGKADERARQFLYWVVNSNAIDNHLVLKQIWSMTSGIAYFFVIIVAGIIGLGFVIGQQANFDLKIRIWPAVWKIVVALLWIAFSASIVLILIQLSELLMKFFMENLGGKDLFNIYFNATSQESNYQKFIGCRDLNLRVQESIQAEMFLLRITNVTYYVMGTMLLLRKILLWFLLFVSPFLALLMPFVFIRNAGWIWIGVFFQWLLYGPLFALFFGALATIWKAGIPFSFVFGRVNSPEGYVYPTGIIITYGGPSQVLSATNNGNYVDTFSEYIISLIMLWAVIFFPWWLLRIFRDYCCDGIYAMKNILMAMYDNSRINPSPGAPSPSPNSTTTKTFIKQQENVKNESSVKMESREQIREVKTEQITKSLHLEAKKLSDIARLETNKQSRDEMKKNIDLLSNPVKAESPTERNKFMNIRSELFSRAIKDDKIARQIMSATSSSPMERIQTRESIIKTTTQFASSSNANRDISVKLGVPQSKIQSVTSAFSGSLSRNTKLVTSVAKSTNMPMNQVQSVLTSYSQNTSQPGRNIVSRISKETNVTNEKVEAILRQISNTIKTTSTINNRMTTEGISKDHASEIMKTISNVSSSTSVSVAERVASISGITVTQTQLATKNIITNIISSPIAMQQIADKTNSTPAIVSKVLSSFAQNSTLTTTPLIDAIVQSIQIDKSIVSAILSETNAISQNIQFIQLISKSLSLDESIVKNILQSLVTSDPASQKSVSETISIKTGMTIEKVTNMLQSLIPSLAQDTNILDYMSGQTNIPVEMITKALNTYSLNISKPIEYITEQIKINTGISNEQSLSLISLIGSNFNESSTIANEISAKEGVKEQDVLSIVTSQIPAEVEPENNIEKTISLPQEISLEEYEEVKNMWIQQYEKGEVPISEVVKSRQDWLENEIVIVTNILNKLLSDDIGQKQSALDELGYVLPVFMMNNMKGPEILVYLKAKIEAAKATIKLIDKENEIKAKILAENNKEENLVSVDRKTQHNENTQTLEMEQDMPENSK